MERILGCRRRFESLSTQRALARQARAAGTARVWMACASVSAARRVLTVTHSAMTARRASGRRSARIQNGTFWCCTVLKTLGAAPHPFPGQSTVGVGGPQSFAHETLLTPGLAMSITHLEFTHRHTVFPQLRLHIVRLPPPLPPPPPEAAAEVVPDRRPSDTDTAARHQILRRRRCYCRCSWRRSCTQKVPACNNHKNGAVAFSV